MLMIFSRVLINESDVIEVRSIAFEFRPFRVLERRFAPKKHWFAARCSIPAWNLRKIEVYAKRGLL